MWTAAKYLSLSLSLSLNQIKPHIQRAHITPLKIRLTTKTGAKEHTTHLNQAKPCVGSRTHTTYTYDTLDRVESGDPHIQAELSDDEDEVAPTPPVTHAISAEAVDTDNLADDGQQSCTSGEANLRQPTIPSIVVNSADSDEPTGTTTGENREEESSTQPTPPGSNETGPA